MKKLSYFIFLLCTVVLISAGCQSEPEPLRVCIDLPKFSSEEPETVAERFIEYVTDLARTTDGPTDIEVEVLPEFGSERKTALTRIRTEIMAGEGPDVFIICNKFSSTSGENALFTMPEKSMEVGIFLSLDEYMEKAQFTEWDKQVQSVMEAGRNEYGQQIIPLTYTFPVTCYRQSEVPHELLKEDTWEAMLQDPSGVLQTAGTWFRSDSILFESWEDDYLGNILGEWADYSTEDLAFSEEELLQRVTEIIGLRNKKITGSFSDVPAHYQLCPYCGYTRIPTVKNGAETSGIKGEEPLTMIPIYSDDGGVSASVMSYAAVNANTKNAEDAFFVIDVLLSRTIQESSTFYNGLMDCSGLPMHEDLLQPDQQAQRASFTDENFAEFCRVRDQITNVYFMNSLYDELDMLYQKCEAVYEEGESIEEIVSESYERMERILRE